MSNGEGVKPIYVKAIFALVVVLASAGHVYISAVFYPARAGERLEQRVERIEEGIKENTMEQRKTQGVIQELMIRMEREKVRRETLEEKERHPLRFPMEGPP